MWFLFALMSAILDALMDVIGKKGLENSNLLPYTISWGITFFGAVFLMPFVWQIGFPHIDNYTFWICLFLGAILNVFAFGNYFTSIKMADLSLIGPLTCLTPVFLLFISPLLLFISGHDISNELPSINGIIGVCLIFVGSYILNNDQSNNDYLQPLKSIFINAGLRKAVFAAFLWSVTMSLSKIAINNVTGDSDSQTALFWGCCLMLAISIFILPFVWKEFRESSQLNSEKNEAINIAKKWQGWQFLILIGLVNAGLMFCQMLALSLIVTAYAIAVKRLGNIFKVILGAFLFQESHLKERIAAASIMVLGVILMTITNIIPFWQLWRDTQTLF